MRGARVMLAAALVSAVAVVAEANPVTLSSAQARLEVPSGWASRTVSREALQLRHGSASTLDVTTPLLGPQLSPAQAVQAAQARVPGAQWASEPETYRQGNLAGQLYRGTATVRGVPTTVVVISVPFGVRMVVGVAQFATRDAATEEAAVRALFASLQRTP